MPRQAARPNRTPKQRAATNKAVAANKTPSMGNFFQHRPIGASAFGMMPMGFMGMSATAATAAAIQHGPSRTCSQEINSFRSPGSLNVRMALAALWPLLLLSIIALALA